MAILEYYNGSSWTPIGGTIILTGAVSGSGNGTINTTLSDLISVSAPIQYFFFPSGNLAALSLNSVSDITEFAINQSSFDVLKIGYNNTLDANYIDSVFSVLHIMHQNNIHVTFDTTGNVGIGTATPHAPLQFANVTLNRKIVLWEDANNDHQFNGFGLNGGNTIRHQVGSSSGAHTFWAATSATSSNELFRITGEGYVGIATGTPKALLQFGNTLQNRMLVLWENNASQNNHEFCGFGINTDNILRYQIGATTGAHRFYAAISSSASNEIFTILGNGNVGIGRANPNAPLQLGNINANRKIVLWENGNNDHQFYGFGIEGGVTGNLRYQTAAGAHVFYTAVSTTVSQEILRMTKEGFVGIDMTTPHAPLHFSNEYVNRKIVLREEFNDDHQFNGFGLNSSNNLRYQVHGVSGAHVFYTGIDSTTSNELVRITGTGFVGIGRSAPNAPLQLGNIIANRKIVLWENVNNDHQFNGFGLNGGNILRYQIGATAGSHVFYSGVNSTTSNELARITGTGEIIAPYIYAESPRIEYSMVNNTSTVTSTANVWTLIAGTSTVTNITAVLFSHTNNRAIYTGTRAITLICTVSATIFVPVATNIQISIAIFVNGVRVTPSQMTTSSNVANFRRTLNTQAMLAFIIPNDYIEVYIMCNTSGIVLNVPLLTVSIHKI